MSRNGKEERLKSDCINVERAWIWAEKFPTSSSDTTRGVDKVRRIDGGVLLVVYGCCHRRSWSVGRRS